MASRPMLSVNDAMVLPENRWKDGPAFAYSGREKDFAISYYA